jgi:transglutaminase-like putative cysteine protease
VIYRVSHLTRYAYAEPVSSCYNLAHLLPRDTSYQRTLHSHLEIAPRPFQQSTRNDYFGNPVCHFTIQEPHRGLEIHASSEIEVQVERRESWLDWGLACGETRRLMLEASDAETLLAREYRLESPLVRRHARLADYARAAFDDRASLLTAVSELNARIHADFTYDSGFTTVSTPLAEVLTHRRGVCQDFAHLAIGCLRALGFAARYVSGYLETQPPPGTQKLRGADASHAWFAVFVPGVGWVEFDPTNGQRAGGGYVTAAWGRDFSDVTPLKGVIFGGGEEQVLTVEVDTDRVD